MTFRRLGAVLLCWLGVLPASAQDLTEGTFPAWRDFILSKPEQLTWKTAIAWEQSLGQGVLKALRHDKPLLLWVEAGDPQGCV